MSAEPNIINQSAFDILNHFCIFKNKDITEL